MTKIYYFIFALALFALSTNAAAENEDCPAHEHYTTCRSGCEAKCGQDPSDIVCTAECLPAGCQCDDGFFRDNANECVTQAECQSGSVETTPAATNESCPAHEHYTTCRSGCEAKCGQDPSEIVCTAECLTAGCQCDDGFFRDNTNECVTQAECESVPAATSESCPANEHYTTCRNGCEAKCGQDPSEIACTEECLPAGCQCDDGFFRDNANECVTQAECQNVSAETTPAATNEECPAHEHYTTCRSGCEAKCGQDPSEIACTEECLPAGCQCDDGFFRDNANECVTQAECESGSAETSRARRVLSSN